MLRDLSVMSQLISEIRIGVKSLDLRWGVRNMSAEGSLMGGVGHRLELLGLRFGILRLRYEINVLGKSTVELDLGSLSYFRNHIGVIV